MGGCCSSTRTCHDPECTLPGIILYQGFWRCDKHNVEWLRWLEANQADKERALGHTDISEDSEEDLLFESDPGAVRISQLDTSVLLTRQHDQFKAVFNEALDQMFYDEEELARAPGLDRDIRRLLYDDRKDTEPGYLYVFRLAGDSPDYYKIGYTKDIGARTKAWRKELVRYGDLEVVLVHRVRRARFAERSVHLLLAPHRVGRYQMREEKRLYTEYFYTKTRDGALPWSPLDPETVPANVRQHKREVEWFHVPEGSVVFRVCAQVVDAIEAFY